MNLHALIKNYIFYNKNGISLLYFDEEKLYLIFIKRN